MANLLKTLTTLFASASVVTAPMRSDASQTPSLAPITQSTHVPSDKPTNQTESPEKVEVSKNDNLHSRAVLFCLRNRSLNPNARIIFTALEGYLRNQRLDDPIKADEVKTAFVKAIKFYRANRSKNPNNSPDISDKFADGVAEIFPNNHGRA
jgi:hypothetical protein